MRSFVSRLFERVCAPLFDMVRRWVTQGDLVDPHSEFFVMEKRTHMYGGKSEELDPWSKYSLRCDMIPRFMPKELANQVCCGKCCSVCACEAGCGVVWGCGVLCCGVCDVVRGSMCWCGSV